MSKHTMHKQTAFWDFAKDRDGVKRPARVNKLVKVEKKMSDTKSVSGCGRLISTRVQELRLALKLRRSKGMRKLTGRNGDADGYALHLGPSPKVNNVQGAICLRLGKGGQRSMGGAVGGGKGCNEHKHMEKQIFPFPAAVREGKCQHALRPRLTVLHSAPPPGPPCSATEYGQQ